MSDFILPSDTYWSIQPQWLAQNISRLAGVDPQSLKPSANSSGGPQPSGEGIALVNLVGPLSKYGRGIIDMLFGGTAMIDAAFKVRQAAANEAVGKILLYIDSPGGTVAGSDELADAIHESRKVKPVIAYVSDLAASGAYLAASQATEIIANQSAVVGSIGVYTVVQDWSRAFENAGVKVHVVKAGKFKGMGAFGSEVTEEQLTEMQATIDSMAANFKAAVARGRNMKPEQVEQFATGKVWIGDEARKLGLVDRIQSFDSLLASLTTKPSQKETSRMSTETPTPATLADLKAALPKADATFILAQLEAGADVVTAQQAYIEHLEKKTAAPYKPGLREPLGNGGKSAKASNGDAIQEWQSQLNDLLRQGMTKQQAVTELMKDEDLYCRYLVQYNAQFNRRFDAEAFRRSRQQ